MNEWTWKESVVQLTDEAIKALREHGWVKGSIWSPEGYCVMGALQSAARKDWLNCYGYGPGSRQQREAAMQIANLKLTEVVRALQVVLHEHGFPGDSVVDWNDKHARDVDEVIGMLKLTGERMEQQTE